MMIRQESPRQHSLCDEHLRLREMLESVRRAISYRPAPRHELGLLFRELAQHIFEHFEHEEAGGYFAAVIETAPQLRDRAGELLGQHPEMTAQLFELQEVVTNRSVNEQWWREVEELFARFLDLFARHEAAENALLQEAYGDDIGAED